MNKELKADIDNKSDSIEHIVKETIKPYVEELDAYVDNLKIILASDKSTLTTAELSHAALTISSNIYSVGSQAEFLAIREMISNQVKTEKFDIVFTNTDGTISDKNAIARQHVIEEDIIELIYKRCYKILKTKSENAEKVLMAVQKVLTIRTKELEHSERGN